MNLEASQAADFGLRPGDHVCAFYHGGGSDHDDIVVDYVRKGLQGGNKCVCFIDTASSVRDRIPKELLTRDDILQFFPEDAAYLTDGHFAKDVFMRNLEGMVQEGLSDGYDSVWVLGDVSVVARNAFDTKTWFAAESEVSELAPRYPQFIMCLYNLDLFDGERVMYVFQTHPRVFVNGMIIPNPYYVPTREFLANL